MPNIVKSTYLPEDKAPNMVVRSLLTQIDVSDTQKVSPGNPTKPNLYGIIAKNALINNERSKELYLRCSTEYISPIIEISKQSWEILVRYRKAPIRHILRYLEKYIDSALNDS